MSIRLLKITIFSFLVLFPVISLAISEQEVENEIDFMLKQRSYVEKKIDAAGESANPILIQLLKKHQGNTERQRIILRLMENNPNPNMIIPVLGAYKNNFELEPFVFGLLLSINTDDAYLEAKEIAFSPKLSRDQYVSNPMDNIRLILQNTTKERLKYIIPHLKGGGLVGEWIIEVMIDEGDPKDIVPPIADLLNEEETYTRLVAAEALGKIGDTSAIPYLRVAKRKETDINVKLAISAQLVKLGEFEELELLIQEIGNESKSIRDAVLYWLSDVTGQDFGEDAAAWRQWFEEEKKKH